MLGRIRILGIAKKTMFTFEAHCLRRIQLLLTMALLPGAASAQSWTFTHLAGTAGGSGSYDGIGSDARFNGPSGVAADSVGNVYVADYNNNTIRKITLGGDVTTLAGLAGRTGFIGSADGTGSAARIWFPAGVAVDSAGIVYVADHNNHTIRKITPAGTVTTLAGLGYAWGSSDGTGSAARFAYPTGVTVDSGGNVYVADRFNSTIRKITPAGVVTTLAGLAGSYGSVDGIGSNARFYGPLGVAVDSGGNVYVADNGNHTIRKITPARVVSTIAGQAGSIGSADGTGSAARFYNPSGVTVDSAGTVSVADQNNNTIRKIDASTVVTTLAGSAFASGAADGVRDAARFLNPCGVTMDSAGNGYVADYNNHTIRKITPGGGVTTLAGLAGNSGSADGTGSDARFYNPTGVTVDSAGNVYVADRNNHTIRKITPAGVVTTLAGLAGLLGTADGTGSGARFFNPSNVAVDSAGDVYVADTNNDTIRRVTQTGVVTTLAGLGLNPGSTDGIGSNARFDRPAGVTVDPAGNVYVTDTYNHTVRKISQTGVVTTFAGLATTGGSADGTGSAARFAFPASITADSLGDVYVADQYNYKIRMITPTGTVTTLAGMAQSPGSADGTGTVARFNYPFGIAVNGAGNLLYVADTSNHSIRQGVPAIPDVAVIDADTGCSDAYSKFDSSPQSAIGWQWRIVRRPSASAAALSSATIRNPTFAPDIGDRYELLLTATDGIGGTISSVALDALAPPVIAAQPDFQSVCEGSSVMFSITAFNTTGFQWYKGGSPISGATGASYTINPVSASNADYYYVIVTNSCGTSASDNAILSVQSVPNSLGNSLRDGKGSGMITLNWITASGATAYYVRRCLGTCLPVLTVASTTGTGYSELNDPNSYFYTVIAANACGATP